MKAKQVDLVKQGQESNANCRREKMTLEYKNYVSWNTKMFRPNKTTYLLASASYPSNAFLALKPSPFFAKRLEVSP